MRPIPNDYRKCHTLFWMKENTISFKFQRLQEGCPLSNFIIPGILGNQLFPILQLPTSLLSLAFHCSFAIRQLIHYLNNCSFENRPVFWCTHTIEGSCKLSLWAADRGGGTNVLPHFLLFNLRQASQCLLLPFKVALFTTFITSLRIRIRNQGLIPNQGR